MRHEEILRAVAAIAPDKVDAVAALLSQPQPSRRRKGGVLVRHERDESLVEAWRQEQALKAAVRELERQELRRTHESVTTIFVYDERIKFRRIPAPTQRHPVPFILSGKVRAGKARVIRYIITLDAEHRIQVHDWSALLKQRRI
jgi:hypothetical protein